MKSQSLPQLQNRMIEAVHEAGHAAVALLTKDRFKGVTLRVSKANPNPRMYRSPYSSGRVRTTAQKRREVAVSLAGPFAEFVFLDSGYLRGASREDIAAMVLADGAADFKDIDEDIEKWPDVELEAVQAEVMGWLEDPDIWLGVMALASALYNRTPKSHIGYREARRIFFGALGK